MSWRAAPGFARLWALLVAAAGVVVLLVAGPLASRAGAHATLIGTSPGDDELVEQAPEQVELRFDEAVETVEGGLQVIDPDGGRADRGEVESAGGDATLRVPVDDAGEGTYTVAWRVVSRDGHNLSGSFVYHVGRRTGAATLDETGGTVTDAVGGAGRWAGFAGALVLVGSGLLATSAGFRARPAPVTAPSGAPSTSDHGDDAGDGEGSGVPVAIASAGSRLRLLMVIGALVGAVGVAAALVAQSATATGRSLPDAVGITLDLALDTRNGSLTVLRVVALLVALVLAALPWTARLPLLAAGAGAVSLVAASLAGHAWTAPQRALAVVSDAVHVLAVGVWLGGLLGLLVVLGLLADPAPLVRRFSKVSLVAFAAVAVTGTVSGVIEVRSFDGLGSTGYGQLLLAKVVGFAVLVGLGFYNRQILLPRVEQVLRRLTGTVRAELGVAVAMLAVTAVLVNQPPARDQEEADSGPYSTTVTAEDGGATMEATVDPAEVGPNDLHLFFYDESGAELVVTAVEVTAAVGDVPPRRLTVTPVTPSHVSVLDASLGSAGRWTFEVTAVTEGQPTDFTLEVPL